MQGGGEAHASNYNPRYKNLTKEDHGQQDLIDLASKSHCLVTPSLITADDYYKANDLNNINLQLHASSEVSNPYSFNIVKNIGFNSKILESESGIYTLTVGSVNILGMVYGYMNNFIGDLSPKIYKTSLVTGTITGFYFTVDNNTLILTTDEDGKYDSAPICTIIDENYPQIQDIVLKYDTRGGYRSILDSDLAQYFQASSTIKFRLK